MKVRVAKKTEQYIKNTMVIPQRGVVILKEKKSFKKQKIEEGELIEEILTHEFLHIVICKIEKDEIVAQTIDDLTKWISTEDGWKIAFVGKKTDKIIYQTPT
jgi:hypothetical protein